MNNFKYPSKENFWGAIKTMLRGKYVALNEYIIKEESSVAVCAALSGGPGTPGRLKKTMKKKSFSHEGR